MKKYKELKEVEIQAISGVSKESFYATLEKMSEDAFDDQCTGANPRYPLISEIKQMYINAFEGKKDRV